MKCRINPYRTVRLMTGPVQHFRSAVLDAWRFHVFAWLPERQVFLGGEFSDFHGSSS